MSTAALLKDEAWKIRINRDEVVKETLKRVNGLISERPYLTVQYRKSLASHSASELVQLLNKGSITSVDILLVLSARAFSVGLDNCLITEEDFQNALKSAEECDKHRRQSKLKNWTFSTPQTEETLPCLYGIPLSVKDTIDLKGFSSTIGVTVRTRTKATEDGLIIDILRKGGLIPFVKTNIPQVAMTYDSFNYVWGRANNPWDIKRTTGGSSGGEGGLIAARGSVLGIGSDIGGSLRIPAEFCGIYSLKPSSNRLSFKGHAEYTPTFNGQINIPAVMGPLGNSPDDLALFMKTANEPSSYANNPKSDPYTLNIPFDCKLYQNFATSKKLRIGYFDSLQLVETTKASKRAVHEVVKVLQDLGHELIPITVKDQKEIVGMYVGVMSAEGKLHGFKEMLQGEEIIPQYKVNYIVGHIPKWINNLLSWAVGKFKPRLAYLLKKGAPQSAYEYLVASYQQQVYKHTWVQYWKSLQLDLVIAPGFGSQSQLHGFSQNAFISAAYTLIWNVLQMTSSSMPITTVREDQQVYESKHNDLATADLKESARGSAGLPVGIQVIGLPYEQQKVLSLMKAIDDRIQFSKHHHPPI